MVETSHSTLRKFITGLAAPVLFSISLSSNATLIFGPAARTQFENFQTTLGDTLETFDGFAAQTDLTTQIPGLTFETTFKRFLPPPGPISQPVHVICSPSNPFSSVCSSADGTNRIIGGTGTNGGATDGQSRYEIVFDTGMLRVGLERISNTAALTSFYSGATLLGQHQNTVNTEFVGFLTDAANPITRVEMDGLACPGAPFATCVLYSNDLFYGNRPPSQAPVPEPATFLLMGLGVAGLGFARRRRLNG